MEEFKLSDGVDNNKIFIVNRSEFEGRLDPSYILKFVFNQIKYKYKTKKLKEIVDFTTGGTPSKQNSDYWDGDIPWVSPKDFKSFYLNDSEDKITIKGLKNSSTKLVRANSILMVVRSGILIHTLPICINTIPVTINQDIKALQITDEVVNSV